MNCKLMEKTTRILAWLLIVLLGGSALVSVLTAPVSAAPSYEQILSIRTTGGDTVSRLADGKKYVIRIEYEEGSLPGGVQAGKRYRAKEFSLNSAWRKNGAELEFSVGNLVEGSSDKRIVVATLKAEYVSASQNNEISIRNIVLDDTDYQVDTISAIIPDSYFGSSSGNSGGNNSGGDDPVVVTPDLVVENAIALDSAGNRIDTVNKDSLPFSVEIVYADMGLREVDAKRIADRDIEAYITASSGFILGGSAKGTVKVVTTDGDYPRFRVTFRNITYNGGGNTLEFRVQYVLDEVDNPVKGTATATVYSAKADEDDDKKDKMAVAVPKIIISQYSYGETTISAGSEFNLNFSLQNTSADVPLENVVVTLTPASNEAAKLGPGLIVASSSSTVYIPVLEAGEAKSYSIAFAARPDAEVTSHLVTVKFSYEYIDTQLKERKTVPDLTESIAIPVSQIDRFSVDPITDSVYGQVGEETYVTVNFINKGKSVVYNISGSVRCDPSISAPSQLLGNLEAGKPASLDFYFTGSEAGTFSGDIVIQYEDESNNTKEIAVPFELIVEAPYFPPVDPNGMEGEPPPPEPKGPGVLSVVLCVVGGLAIAAPIALYLMKRVKAKGSEDFDEIF